MIGTSLALQRFAALPLLCCALLMAPAGQLAAQQPQTTPTPTPAQSKSTLTVHINGIRNTKGKIHIALFRDAKGFPSDIASAVAAQKLEIAPQTLSATAVFADLPQGVYAVSLFHDENLTGKLEYDAQGVPRQGYGLSNNPDTSHGPPTPEQGKFQLNQPEATIEIKLVYWQ
jgi:uncharacterized protein (DUF2141 family)